MVLRQSQKGARGCTRALLRAKGTLEAVANKIIAACLEAFSPFAIVEKPMTTVAQLINQLSRLDQDAPVIVHDPRGKLAQIEEVALINYRALRFSSIETR
jgi:hypothetical protein